MVACGRRQVWTHGLGVGEIVLRELVRVGRRGQRLEALLLRVSRLGGRAIRERRVAGGEERRDGPIDGPPQDRRQEHLVALERREAMWVETQGFLDPEELPIADVAVVVPELALVRARRDRRRVH